MDLPHEVLSEILSYVDVKDLQEFTEAVPKSDFLLHNPKLWVSVDFHRVLSIRDEILEILCKYATHVQSLALNNPNILVANRTELCKVMGLMTNVTYLDVSMCSLIADMDFLLSMNKLEHLVVDCMSVLTMHSFQEYLPKCRSIRTLSMKGNAFLTMTDVAKSCSQLVNLCFLDTQGTCDFTPDHVTQILNGCPNLKTFLFNSFYFSWLYRQWVELVNIRFPHVTYHYTTYQQVTRFKRILSREINL